MVIIMRGVSGGGKSTFARRLKEAGKPERGEQLADLIERANALKGGREIFSADDFFIRNGEYKFDRSRIGEAHAWCLQQFVEVARVDTRNLLIVDNTNTTVGEIAPYAAVAKAYGHEVHVVEVDPSTPSPVGSDAAIVGYTRNVHGVPLETTERQLRNIQQSRGLIKDRYGTFHILRTAPKGTV